MIKSSMDGGHIDDCLCIFEYMKDHCAPNIGTINTMLKVYGRNDMFSKAKVLFEEVKVAKSDSYAIPEGGSSSVVPDAYTYNSMLEVSASAHQWEYFEHVYREMILSGYHLDQNKNLSLLVKSSRAGKVENILFICIRFYFIFLLIVSYEYLIKFLLHPNYISMPGCMNFICRHSIQCRGEKRQSVIGVSAILIIILYCVQVYEQSSYA